MMMQLLVANAFAIVRGKHSFVLTIQECKYWHIILQVREVLASC